MDMTTSKIKQRLAQLSSYLDSVGLSIMYKSFVHSCLEYGHLLYFGAGRGYLKHLDALQCLVPVFVMAPFLPCSPVGMPLQLVSCVDY